MEKRMVGVAAILLIIGGLALGLVLGNLSGGDGSGADALEHTITVQGQGSVNTAPDVAVLQIGVRSEGETAEEAFGAVDQRVTAVQGAITGAGVSAEDVQTQDLQVDKRIENRGEGNERSFYVAEQRLQVKVREVNDAGTVASAAIGAGANIVGGIEFQLSDKEPSRNQALQNAVQAARDKADALAGAADATVGRVILIDETNTTFDTVHRSLLEEAWPGASPGDQAFVAPGQVETAVEVTVIYELEP